MTQPTVERLKADIDALVGWVNSAFADIARLEDVDEQVQSSAVAALDHVREVVGSQVAALRTDVAQLSARLEALEQRAITHENRMTGHERAIDEQLRTLTDTSAERLQDLHETVIAAGGKAVVRQVIRDSAGRITGSVEVDATRSTR